MIRVWLKVGRASRRTAEKAGWGSGMGGTGTGSGAGSGGGGSGSGAGMGFGTTSGPPAFGTCSCLGINKFYSLFRCDMRCTLVLNLTGIESHFDHCLRAQVRQQLAVTPVRNDLCFHGSTTISSQSLGRMLQNLKTIEKQAPAYDGSRSPRKINTRLLCCLLGAAQLRSQQFDPIIDFFGRQHFWNEKNQRQADEEAA